MNEPITIGLRRRADSRLVLDRDGAEVPVKASQAFPWKEPRLYVSLRDDKGKEVQFVESLDGLPPEERLLLESELGFRTHIARIIAIHAIIEVLEDYWWQVETDGGPRSFLTSRQDNERTLADGRVVLRDRYGEWFMVENPQKLPRPGRDRFLEIVDC